MNEEKLVINALSLNDLNQFKRRSLLKTFSISLVLVFTFLSATLFGATIYIDPTNTSNNQDGSQTNPYNSWTKVTFTNGNTYLQKGGTTFTTSGIAINSKSNIIIGSYGSGRAKIVASGNGNHILNVSSSSNITVKDLEITTAGKWVSGIYINGTNSASNLIDNCLIHNVEWGIRIITNSSGNKIMNSTIHNIGDDGIYVKDAASIEVGYSHIYDVNKKFLINPDQSYSAGDGIQIASTNSHSFYIHNNIIDHSSMGNKFCFIAWGNNYTGILENNVLIGNANKTVSAIYLSPTTKTVTVRYNEVKNSNYGIYSYANLLDAYYNIFSQNRSAINVLNGYTLNARNNVFYNNTNTAVSSTPSTSVTLRNNIFHVTSGGKAINTNGTISSNNNVFNQEQSGLINGHATLSSWRNASGNDANSVVGNPSFVSPTSGDFHVQSNSIAVNKGAGVGLNRDYFGGSVPQGGTPDVGIHEIVGGSGNTTNNAPQISNQSFNVLQTAPIGTVVGTVSASDPDAGQNLTYSIISGNTNSVFAIASATGRITVAKALPAQNFSLVVKVTDNGNPVMSAQATVTISVTASSSNQAPVINNQSFTVSQSAGIGTVVGRILASDPDQGQTISYSIVSGNTNSVFSLNSSTGNLTVAKALPAQTFSLVVKVTDNGNPIKSAQATVTVNVTSSSTNNAPVIANQSFTAYTAMSVGTLIGKVVASDPDANQTLTYSIVSGNINTVFALNSSTGNITVAKTLPAQIFSLVVKVTDNGNPVKSAQATITITVTSSNGTNQPPYLPASTFSIRNHAPNGTFVGKLNATDPNPGQKVTYTIVSGNTGNAFTLNRTNGAINVRNSSAVNINVTPKFTLKVRVTDDGNPSLSFTQTITVNVTRAKIIDGIAVEEKEVISIDVPKEIRVYPNPSVDGRFSVSFGKQCEEAKIEAFDMSGRLIKTMKVTQDNKGLMDLSNSPSGAYLIRLDNGSEVKTLKAVKH